MLASKTIVKHSLFWLVLGNVIGLILSILLLAPNFNVAPITFGRLVPLHLNFLLYGWCALPLLALLYHWLLPEIGFFQYYSSEIVYAWSAALVYGGYRWITGHSSGKIFLEWEGQAKYFYIIVLALLWLLLAAGYLFRFRSDILFSRILKSMLLLILGLTPAALGFAFRPDVFPPINPDSSGATGASLLISSVAVVAIILLMPLSIGIAKKEKFLLWPYFILLVIHVLFWSMLPHGHSSNHDNEQILGLSSMLIWIPVFFIYYAKFDWNSVLWLYSFAFWGSALIVTACLMFLPGNLELAKFTSLLVAHVHIAMAGMVSSFLILLLSNQLKLKRLTDVFSSEYSFYLWQLGLIIHILALFLLSLREVNQNHFLFSDEFNSYLPLFLRVCAGVVMTSSSVKWLFTKINYEHEVL